MSARPILKYQIAPKHLSILLLPVLVLIASEVMLGMFGDHGLSLGTVDLAPEAKLLELAGRYTFLAVAFFFVAAALAVIAVFVIDLVTRQNTASIRYTVLAMLATIAVSLVFSEFEPAWLGSFESHQLVGKDLLLATLGQGEIAACVPGSPFAMRCKAMGSFLAMDVLMDKINILSALSATCVAAGMVLTLSRRCPPDLQDPDARRTEIAALKEAQLHARRYLYLSGVLLSAGMALAFAWMLWPAPMIADTGTRAAYGELVDGIALFRGVSYTVLILSYYMPVSLILMVRVNRCLDASAAAGTSAEQTGITPINTLDALKTILAILSPVIASAVGSFANLSGLG